MAAAAEDPAFRAESDAMRAPTTTATRGRPDPRDRTRRSLVVVILDLDPTLGHDQQAIWRALVVRMQLRSFADGHGLTDHLARRALSRRGRNPSGYRRPDARRSRAGPSAPDGRSPPGDRLGNRGSATGTQRSGDPASRPVGGRPPPRPRPPCFARRAASIEPDRRVSIRPATRPFAAVRAQRVRPLHLSRRTVASILDGGTRRPVPLRSSIEDRLGPFDRVGDGDARSAPPSDLLSPRYDAWLVPLPTPRPLPPRAPDPPRAPPPPSRTGRER